MLVHAPKLVNCAEVSQSLDILLVPPILLVLRVQRIRMVQLTTNMTQSVYQVFTYPSEFDSGELFVSNPAIAGSTSTIVKKSKL